MNGKLRVLGELFLSGEDISKGDKILDIFVRDDLKVVGIDVLMVNNWDGSTERYAWAWKL